MKQQALTIAAATMLTVGLGIANASEQSGMLEQSTGTDMAACSSDHNPCLNNDEMTNNDEMINEGKQVSQDDTEVIILEERTEDAEAQDQAKEEDSGTAEQASDESHVPDVIIFVQ
jgi:hypothetical protein